MDRISNNESLITFATLQILTLFNDIDIAKLDLLLILCVDRAIRNRLVIYQTYQDCVDRESVYEYALNRKFNEFQPIILNALTMMQMEGLTEFSIKGNIQLSEKGLIIAGKSVEYSNNVTAEIFNAANKVWNLLGEISAHQLYNDLSIVL